MADAEKLYRETLAIQSRTHGPEHPRTLLTKSELADELFKEGHIHEAEKLHRETLATMVRVIGPEHPSTLVCQSQSCQRPDQGGPLRRSREKRSNGFRRPHSQSGPAASLYSGCTAATRHGAWLTPIATPRPANCFATSIEKQDSSKGQGDRFSVWYSFACVAVAANHPDDALQYLREAIQARI